MAAGPRGMNSGPCRHTVGRQAQPRGQPSQPGRQRGSLPPYRMAAGLPRPV